MNSQNDKVNIYIDWVSGPCRAVLTFCQINNIPHNIVETRLNKKQN